MKKFPTFKGFLLAALMLFTLALGAFSVDPGFAAPAAVAYATTITVDSSADLSNSDSNTCISHTPCTLRRAVIQARSATKPVLIQFNIPTTDAGYDSTLNIWRITFLYYSSTANATLRYLNGEITIDGSTQPGGRTAGPKIILVGPAAERDGIKLGETATQNANQIIGLGFQNFKTHIYVNSSNNLIKDNWFGLSADGTNIALRAGGEDDGSGNTGISVMTGANTNIIQNNVFAGLAGVAASIIGNNNTFAGNRIGTRADGTVPDLFPSLVCSQWDWLGGSGISLAGDGNLVENNLFAGLRIAVVLPTIQADTIRVGNDHHIIRNNQIGVDSANSEVGVCGRGIYLQSSTKFNQVTSNTIVNPGYSAISLNDTPVVSTSDANTLRSNVIKKDTPWGEIAGNNSPEDAIQIAKSLPDAFRNFKPAKITLVNGVTVTGTSGDSSPCPSCIIEVFLDDTDAIAEALQSLAVVNADASGNWTATLPAALGANQRLRTTSTTTIHNTIAGMSAGTTTGLSGDPNQTPTDIALSNASVMENQPVGATVGTLSTTDPDAGNTHTYSFACTTPGADDGSFSIVGDALKTSAIFDYETKNSYSICIRTDDGNGGTFDKAFTITVTDVNETFPATFRSVGASDGWVLESSETSGKGRTLNAKTSTFQLGDDALNCQYQAILSFDLSSLPVNATITSVKLRIKPSGQPVGGNPFTLLGSLLVDIRKGAFGKAMLEAADFQAAATAKKVGIFGKTPVSGWYNVTLNAVGMNNINKGGITQFRLYFTKGDNNNRKADLMKFFSGNSSTGKPELIITYSVP